MYYWFWLIKLDGVDCVMDICFFFGRVGKVWLVCVGGIGVWFVIVYGLKVFEVVEFVDVW